MDRLFQECYSSRLGETGYVLPFFWQHGEDHETLRREMDAIRRAGNTEFCVESRTHEEFCKDQWWEDFAFMLEYARQHGMRVWLLDDKKFPTGYANGYIEAHPELRRRILRLDYRDYVGPTAGTRLDPVPLKADKEESFVSIVAWKQSSDFTRVVGKPVDLTHRIGEDGLIQWDLPEGPWRVYYAIVSRDLTTKPNYIDMLSAESCKAMLHAVYEPHYEHFKDYFGNTFRGFFSDEPSFANGSRSYRHTVGTEDLQMPWSAELPALIAAEIGKTEEEVLQYLPALWHTLPAFGPAVRAGYMDRITKLYDQNFTKMLGDWCRERKVLYIGHIIEDNNTHQRLGYGAGHYFRALRGQDMAGIDIVLNQMIPFNTHTPHRGPVCEKVLDPEFFHYALGKLAASLCHTHPHMENRAMAEVFGAFGWAEGVGYMKYLADHFLACGINHFVPHAYTPKYPDRDCPPHFYAAGKNPQEKAFGLLTRYMQKIARLTCESVHKADVAVFYNAEGEWTGGKYTLFQKTCRILTQNQIDFDVLPEDILEEASVSEGTLLVNQETYGALIVPYSEILPDKILATFARLQKEGLTVIFEEKAPARSACGIPAKEILEQPTVVKSRDLAATLREMGCFHLLPATPCPNLRSYRVDREDRQIYLLFNEGRTPIDTWITLTEGETPVFFDVWNNKVTKPAMQDGKIRLQLPPAGATVLLCGDGRDALPHRYDLPARKDLAAEWTLSVRNAGEEDWSEFEKTSVLRPFNLPDRLPEFCGFIRYEASFTATGSEKILDLGAVGEIATVTVNGRNCGTAVNAPYRFEIGKAVKEGENTLTVEVVNSPVYRERSNDNYSTYHPLPASGLLGPVKIG
ncbi:MAG: glycosyl transferase family 2 [Clostridia bacterium]|nr:glycosyl transferase family 2 [Clostridia bacterium]